MDVDTYVHMCICMWVFVVVVYFPSCPKLIWIIYAKLNLKTMVLYGDRQTSVLPPPPGTGQVCPHLRPNTHSPPLPPVVAILITGSLKIC